MIQFYYYGTPRSGPITEHHNPVDRIRIKQAHSNIVRYNVHVYYDQLVVCATRELLYREAVGNVYNQYIILYTTSMYSIPIQPATMASR